MVYYGPIISGLLAQLLFAPYGWGFLAPVVLVPLFLSYFRTQKNRSIMVFALVLIAGFHNWVFSLKAFASPLSIGLIFGALCLYYASFYAIGFALLGRMARSPLYIAALWTVIEWIKSLGPFGNPAANIAYSQAQIPIIAKLASVGGVLLITFVLVLINACIASIIHRPKDWKHYVLILAITGLGMGGVWLLPLTPQFVQSIPIHISQQNHPQPNKLNSKTYSSLLSDYLKDIQNQAHGTLVITPETIVPDLIQRHKSFIRRSSKWTKTHSGSILFGALSQTGPDYFNSVYLVQAGEMTPVYHKKTLMPFGEYLPFRGVFEALNIQADDLEIFDFSKGAPNQPLLTYQDAKLGLGICLESVYEAPFRLDAIKGADAFITFANHAWFWGSSAAEKHLEITRFRAIETGRPIVFVSNRGTSAVISETGQLLNSSQSSDSFLLTIQRINTPYLRAPYWILLACILILGYGIWKFVRQKRSDELKIHSA